MTKNADLSEIRTLDADEVAYYVQRGRALRSKAASELFVAIGHGLVNGIKKLYHLATDWMVDIHHHRAH